VNAVTCVGAIVVRKAMGWRGTERYFVDLVGATARDTFSATAVRTNITTLRLTTGMRSARSLSDKLDRRIASRK
jgi:hypothetical protein